MNNKTEEPKQSFKIETSMGHLNVSLNKETQAHLASKISSNDVFFKPLRNPDGTIEACYAKPWSKEIYLRKYFGGSDEPEIVLLKRWEIGKDFIHWKFDSKGKGHLYLGTKTAEELYGIGVSKCSTKIVFTLLDDRIVFFPKAL